MGKISDNIDSFTAVFENTFQKTLGANPNKPRRAESNDNVIAPSTSPDLTSIAVPAQLEELEEGDAINDTASNKDNELEADNDAPLEWDVQRKTTKKRYLGFLRSKRFLSAFFIGQVISLCLTCTNTMITEMGNANTSMPLFQNLLNYALLALVHNTIMLYKYGFKKWARILIKDSWRFFILAFIDVQGNFFVTLAYEYTNMLSAALLDNFAIVVVVILSFVFLHVRYHWSQYIGIIVTIGGMALLIVSDELTGKDFSAPDHLKGDLFVLLGAACYGFSNTFEEYLVSERPIYEVLGNLGFWATCINGVQLAIFERKNVRDAHWTPQVGGYLAGYVLTMFLLYHLAPLMFRLSSAAFYNLNTLTSDFWSLLVGIEAFGYYVYWLYPVGFVFTVLGIVCYCAAPMSDLGESVKPWLGPDQEDGVEGYFTAKHAQNRRRRQQGYADADGERRDSEYGDSTRKVLSTTSSSNRVDETARTENEPEVDYKGAMSTVHPAN